MRALALRADYPQAARNRAKTVEQLDHPALMRLGQGFIVDRQFDAAARCSELAAAHAPDDAVRQYGRAQQLHPRDSTRVLAATRLPAVYDSHADLLAWRQRLRDELDALRRENFRLDVTHHAAPNLFLLAYQGLNDRDLLRDYAALIAPPPDPPPPAAPRDRRNVRIRVASSPHSSAATRSGGSTRG